MIIRASMLLVALWLAGCSVIPEKIRVADESSLVSYEQAASQAEQVKGQMLRWGGAIAKIENKAESTLLEMVHYPLNSYGRPISSDESIGRFRIHVNGFMDPMVYQVGRLMTFTAELNGVEEGLVGEHKYVFPTGDSKAYYLWKNISRVDISGVHIWPYDYWYGHYPRHYPRRVIIRNSGGRHHSGGSNHSGKVTRPSGGSTLPKPVRIRDEN